MKRSVAIFGKNNIAVNILSYLLKQMGNLIDIVLVVPNNSDNGEDGWQRSLLKFSLENNLFTKKIDKINAKESIELLKSMNIDFIFSFQYDQIIGKNILSIPKYGAINLHFAPLPKYRGVSPIAWALINGEEEFGVTIHYMDQGVDTGDIISQTKFSISEIKTARELYDVCTIKGLNLFKDSIKDIIILTNKRFPQDNSKALYYGKGSIDFSKNIICWNKDTRSLYNWIRAFIFPPFQYPIFEVNGKKLKVLSASPDYRKNAFEKPGTIIESFGNFYKISTHDSYINIIVDNS